MLGLRGSWEVYKGDQEAGEQKKLRPLFRAWRVLGGCTVSMAPDGGKGEARGYCCTRRSRRAARSKVYEAPTAAPLLVAEAKRKKHGSDDDDGSGSRSDVNKGMVGKDVYSLEVQQGMDQALVMAILMITKLKKQQTLRIFNQTPDGYTK